MKKPYFSHSYKHVQRYQKSNRGNQIIVVLIKWFILFIFHKIITRSLINSPLLLRAFCSIAKRLLSATGVSVQVLGDVNINGYSVLHKVWHAWDVTIAGYTREKNTTFLLVFQFSLCKSWYLKMSIMVKTYI